jgi:hypothetical protein
VPNRGIILGNCQLFKNDLLVVAKTEIVLSHLYRCLSPYYTPVQKLVCLLTSNARRMPNKKVANFIEALVRPGRIGLA